MPKSVDRFQRILLMIVLLAGLSARLAVLSVEPEQLVRSVPDDAFYYFKVAQNIIAGYGSTLDGINPTNGFHPLWMVLLLPIAALVHEPWQLVRSALALGILFSTGTAFLLFSTLRKRVNLWSVPIVGMALYFLNERSIANSLNGLETAVSSFFFMLALYLILSENEPSGRLRRRILLGLSLGLLFLARTDNVFYIAALFWIDVYRNVPQHRLRTAILTGGVVALVISPWLLWNFFSFGTIFQDSGFAVPYVLRESFLLNGHSGIDALGLGLYKFTGFIAWKIYKQFLGFPPVIYIPAMLGTLLLIARRWKYLRKPEYTGLREIVQVLIALGGAGLLLIFVHTFMRWYTRLWYFDQLIILSAIAFGIVLALIKPQKPLEGYGHPILSRLKGNDRILSYAIALVVTIATIVPSALSVHFLISKGTYSHQIEFLDAARWLKANTEESTTTAAFNAGVVSFFSDRRVVNLDGVINNAAYEALKKKELLAYAENLSIDYFVDFDPVMLDKYAPFMGSMNSPVEMKAVQNINRLDVSWKGCSINIYEVSSLP